MRTAADRIKDIMSEKNWGRADLARHSGVAESSIQRYISGYTPTIPSDKLVRIAQALRVPEAYILGTGAFADWDSILAHTESFLLAVGNGRAATIDCLFDIDIHQPEKTTLESLILLVSSALNAAVWNGDNWELDTKIAPPPSSTPEPAISSAHQALHEFVDSLSPEEAERLIQIAQLALGR